MQITILGAAGRIGKEVVKQALKAGYRVKVLVRNPDKLSELKENVEIVQGNLLDPLSVGRAMEGSNVIINVSGAAKEPDQIIKFQEIGKIMVEQMREKGITRLINISGAVMALPGEKFEFKRKALKVMIYLFYKQMKLVQETIMTIILKEKNIEWTFVRPAMISDKKSNGKVLVDDKKLPGTTVTLEDLGKFMVDQVVSKEWIKKGPMLASAL